MGISAEQESELLPAAIAGDKEALQRLLYHHLDAIETVVRSRFSSELAGHMESTDLTQEVLVKIYRMIGRYREIEGSNFRSWMETVAEKHIIDVVRRLRRIKRGGNIRRVPIGRTSTEDSLDGILNWVCEDSRLPDLSARRKEAKEAIQVCLPCLDTVHRDVVVAHYFEQLETNEIAARINRSPGAVRELLRRSREKLRNMLGTASAWFSSR